MSIQPYINRRFPSYLARLAFLFIVACGSGASAQSVTALNTDNVKDFVLETTRITSGNSRLRGTKIEDYLGKHVHEDARFRSTMRTLIPGFPAQETSLVLNKTDFIESTKKGTESLNAYESTIEIEDIKISTNKRQATLKTMSNETGEMPVQGHIIPIEGISKCTQILKLEDGYIQMHTAVCLTEMKFKP